MSEITAVVRVEHPDIVLTKTVTHDRSSVVKSVLEAGTDPSSGRFFYRVESADFSRFEAGLRADHTIDEFDRVVETSDGQAIYSFAYTEDAKVISPIISSATGVILEMENDGIGWLLTIWMPDRTKLALLWDFAEENGIDIELLRVNEYAGIEQTDSGLTDSQREALLVAFELGYFDDPRQATLGDVAAALDISKPAASGLLRRGTRRLIVSSLVEDGESRGWSLDN